MPRNFEVLAIDYDNARIAAEVGLFCMSAYALASRRKWKQRSLKAERFDPKTGLYNYPAFEKMITRRTGSIRHERDSNRVHGLIFADVDGFKRWNDLLSHPGADKEVLLPVANAFASAVRPDDLVCRMNTAGEEIVVFLADVDEAGEMGVEAFCHRFQYPINDIKPGGGNDNVGVSMAYTTFKQGEDFRPLISDLSAITMDIKKSDPRKNRIVSLRDHEALTK